MVEKLPFGSGSLYRITVGSMSADVIAYGASLQALRVPDREGRPVDVALGYGTPEEYPAKGGCLGASVGRWANRIGGAAFELGGKRYTIPANEGRNSCHCGSAGLHKREWTLAAEGEDTVVCSIHSPDGDGGFPGDLRLEVRYILSPNALTIRYRAVSDADTALNVTNHSYFNLAGHDAGTVRDHIITLNASRFTPLNAEKIPTGELREVAGTAWDLRSPTLLGERLGHPDLPGGFDHNFVLDSPQGGSVYCPKTGIRMDFVTDQPGVQLYTAGGLSQREGKAGAQYAPGCSLCLETQHFPDAVNKPHFPSTLLKAGEEFFSETAYIFSVE